MDNEEERRETRETKETLHWICDCEVGYIFPWNISWCKECGKLRPQISAKTSHLKQTNPASW